MSRKTLAGLQFAAHVGARAVDAAKETLDDPAASFALRAQAAEFLLNCASDEDADGSDLTEDEVKSLADRLGAIFGGDNG